ncbi:hypothetical protein [Streptomyces sp. NPDC001889]
MTDTPPAQDAPTADDGPDDLEALGDRIASALLGFTIYATAGVVNDRVRLEFSPLAADNLAGQLGIQRPLMPWSLADLGIRGVDGSSMPTHTSLYLPPAAASAFAEIIETRVAQRDAEQASTTPDERPKPRGEPTAVPGCPDCMGSGKVGQWNEKRCDCINRQWTALYAARAAGRANHNPVVDVHFQFDGGRPEEYLAMTATPLPGEEVLWADMYEDEEGTEWEDTQSYVVRERVWALGPQERPGLTQPCVTIYLSMVNSIFDEPRPGYAEAEEEGEQPGRK